MKKKKNYRTVRKHYPDEQMWVDIKVYNDQTEEEAIRDFEERRQMHRDPMRRHVS